MGKKTIKTVKDLKVYTLTYTLAMEIFEITKRFPKEEIYSVTDQIRRFSRSATINIREGFAKKKYENVFIQYLVHSIGSSEETRGWLEFSKDCKYISTDKFNSLDNRYGEVGAMLHALISKWKSFYPPTSNF